MKRPGKKTEVDGITFDSAMESRYYKQLKEWKALGIVESFELQPEFILQERFTKFGRTIRPITYKADFFVVYTDGRIEVVDVKGYEDEVFRIRKKIFEYKFREYPLKLYTDELKRGEFIEYKDMIREKGKRKREIKQGAKPAGRGKRRTRVQKGK